MPNGDQQRIQTIADEAEGLSKTYIFPNNIWQAINNLGMRNWPRSDRVKLFRLVKIELRIREERRCRENEPAEAEKRELKEWDAERLEEIRAAGAQENEDSHPKDAIGHGIVEDD